MEFGWELIGLVNRRKKKYKLVQLPSPPHFSHITKFLLSCKSNSRREGWNVRYPNKLQIFGKSAASEENKCYSLCISNSSQIKK